MEKFVVVRGTSNLKCYGFVKYIGKDFNWVITDGTCVWSEIQNEESFKDLADNDVKSISYWDSLRKLCSNELKFELKNGNSELIIHLSSRKSINLPARYDIDLKSILYDIAEHTITLQRELNERKTRDDNISFLRFPAQKVKKRKVVQRKPGMSMLNPSSRKTKAPAGVVFD